jgi:hypothetical protein
LPNHGRRIRRRTVLALFSGIPLLASSVAPVPSGAAGNVTVAADTATLDAPQGIKFHLEAQAQEAEIAALALLYRPAAAVITRRSEIPIARGQRVALDYTLDTQSPFLPPVWTWSTAGVSSSAMVPRWSRRRGH